VDPAFFVKVLESAAAKALTREAAFAHSPQVTSGARRERLLDGLRLRPPSIVWLGVGEDPAIPLLVVVLFLALGIAITAFGIAFRLGRFRGAARYYGDSIMPFYARNAPFALVPSGLLCLCWFAAGVAIHLDRDSIGTGLLALGLIFAPIAVLMTYSPPSWIKPTWLRSAEQEPGGAQAALRRRGIY
jgi:hypothetical protein